MRMSVIASVVGVNDFDTWFSFVYFWTCMFFWLRLFNFLGRITCLEMSVSNPTVKKVTEAENVVCVYVQFIWYDV